MPKTDIETHKKTIIQKLQEAGKKGLTKSRLGIKSSSGLKAQALKDLEKSEAVVNLGSKTKSFYVLQEFNKPLEMACEHIETKLNYDKIDLLSKSKIDKMLKGVPAAVKKKIDEAIKTMVNENRFLKVKQGRNTLLLFVPAVLNQLPDGRICSKTPEKPDKLNRETVLEAYKKVSQRAGFSNIEIYELQKELNIPMEVLKEFIIKQNEQGRVILTKGDHSLYSEEIRSAAVEISGISYLLIRFKE